MKRMLIPALILLHYITGCSPSPNGSDPNSNPTGSLMNLLGTSSANQKLQAFTQVSGILRDANDDPIANATLDLNLSLGRSVEPLARGLSDTRTTTDSEGAYTLNLRLGKFEISVTKADGTKLGSFSMDVVDSKTPPTVATTSNLLKPSGTQIAGIGAPPPSLGNLKLESISYSVATIGKDVNSTISPKITGGKPNICSITPSLPAGLTLSNTTCRISGTPTTLQSSTTYTVTATNAGGSVTGTVKITVILIPPSNLNYTSLALGKDRSATINPTTLSGSAPTSCTANPSLPTGLSISNSTCVISGTPTALQGTTNYTITATNSAGSTTASIALSVIVLPPSSLAYSGSPFTFYLTFAITSQSLAYSGSPITSCSISPSLPSGLSFNTTTCAITGTPTVTSSATTYTITATNSAGSATTTISILTRYGPVVAKPTGLIWQRCLAGQPDEVTCLGYAQDYDYYQGLEYCESLILAGKTSWRLPTKDELTGILNNYSNLDAFPGFYNRYWSSDISYTGTNVVVSGNIYGSYYYTYRASVRCVTGP